jgi:lysophospholipid acyltransferase (LPLAT)-like uncharacterized protein
VKRRVKKYIQIKLLPYILYIITKIIYFTNKKIFNFPINFPKEPIIASVWHGQLLMHPFVFRKLRGHNTFKGIISTHSDGESIAKMLNLLGVGSIRGSSTRGGAKALIGAIKELKNGTDIAITPDGPKGPIYSIADGIVAISQKTNTKILAFSFKASKYWQFNSWDKFKIPKPFGIINFYVSEPFDVNGLEMEKAKEYIKKRMMENVDV